MGYPHYSTDCDEHWALVTNHPLAQSGVLDKLLNEYDSAKAKHGEMTLDGSMMTNDDAASDLLRLAALAEEVGEVAETLTYDKPNTISERIKELVQVANVALTWASYLEMEAKPA